MTLEGQQVVVKVQHQGIKEVILQVRTAPAATAVPSSEWQPFG